MRFSAVIVAAGAGRRVGGDVPKQWRLLDGRPLVRWSLDALLAAGAQEVVVVIGGDDAPRAEAAFAGAAGAWRTTAGGAERIDSVRAGLAALSAPHEAVLIHDAARPFVTSTHVETLLAALETADGALPALPASDTLKRADAFGLIAATEPREGLWRAQTPQAFRREAIADAYARWPDGAPATDDAAVLEAAGGRVVVIQGDPRLMKVTQAEDFPMAETMARTFGAAQTSVSASGPRIARVGQGLDAHAFTEGDGVWLCGIKVAHDKALLGHSDADAGLHAITDALLGAVGEGDIGDHFPPTDPQWKGAASDQFLIHALKLAQAKGARLLNVDVTLVCERPKIKPHRAAMRARVAQILSLPEDRVNVKATTMERMGFTGREEGVVASAVVCVDAPA